MRQKALEKRIIKRLDMSVTLLGYGALEIGRDWGIGSSADMERPSEETTERVLHTVLDSGINLIDTASAYHRSEERIGKFLASRRNEFILASKCGEHSNEPDTYYDYSYEGIKQSIDKSLKLLQTDVIDIMQIHFGPNPDRVIASGETVRAMKDAQKEGKIRFLGASIDGEYARQCIESGDFDVMQMRYNLLDQENKYNIALCKEKGMGVFIRSGLAKGKLTSRVLTCLNDDFPEHKQVKALLALVKDDGNLLTSLALQFLYQNEGISSILIGTKNEKRIKQNIQLLGREVEPALLQKALDIVS